MKLIQAYNNINKMSNFEILYALYSLKKMKESNKNIEFCLYIDKKAINNFPKELLNEYGNIIEIEDKISDKEFWAGIKFYPLIMEKEPYVIIDLDAFLNYNLNDLKKMDKDIIFSHLEYHRESHVYDKNFIGNFDYKWIDWKSDETIAMNCSFVFFNENFLKIKEEYLEEVFRFINYFKSNKKNRVFYPIELMCIVEQLLLFHFLRNKKMRYSVLLKNEENENVNALDIKDNPDKIFKHMQLIKQNHRFLEKKSEIISYNDVIHNTLLKVLNNEYSLYNR